MDVKDKLQKPFRSDEIEWRVGATNKEKTKGLALTYVTNRAIQSRLDDVFGLFGWKNEFKEWKGKSQICGISVWLEDRQEWITKWDGADDSSMEATKGGLSDSMKRCACQWGIGRYLYKLPQEWVKLKPLGGSYTLEKIPKLPNWALPEEESFTPITNKQRNEISELALERGITNAGIKNLMQDMFNVSSSMELDAKTTYKELVSAILKVPTLSKEGEQ